jgi:hypothetical protein
LARLNQAVFTVGSQILLVWNLSILLAESVTRSLRGLFVAIAIGNLSWVGTSLDLQTMVTTKK